MRWAAAILGVACLGMADATCDLEAASADRAGPGCERVWMDANLKLNDLLMVGTHNSYKEAMPAPLMTLLRRAEPVRADSLDYGHEALSRQLDDGARQLEIDIYHDPEGGRFLAPAGLPAAGLTLDPARRAALAAPGFKVMHVQDLDVFSVCVRLSDCLGVIRRWSLAHPDHAPLLLMVNAKTGPSPLPKGTAALPFDAAAWDALDREVRQVFPADALITPDDVQGGYPTLRAAVLAGAWPTLGRSRGKVMFALDEDDAKTAAYRGARRSLEGRVFFINTDESSPAAGYLTLNDPVADGARIRAAVKAGFIVRTRADADTAEARKNDTRRRDAAMASGAQYVSTDYMRPDARFAGGYRARLAGEAAALCNPVRAAGRCGAAVVDRTSSPDGGYLTPETTPDGVRLLGPPPAPGGARAAMDRRVFQETRALKDTPRWSLATADVSSDTFDHYACAIGVRLTPERAPALARLLDRAGSGGIVGPAKSYWGTRRPYLAEPAPTCQPQTEHLAGNPDYPSGHAGNGWLEALLLAELIPDRATEILARGRAFGESRAVCGAHTATAVDAGFMAGAAAAAVLHAQPAFRRDLEAARTEVARVRAQAPAADPAFCRAEAAALAQGAY